VGFCSDMHLDTTHDHNTAHDIHASSSVNP